MKTKDKNPLVLPKIVAQIEWQKALNGLLVKEKATTRACDALAAERRWLPHSQHVLGDGGQKVGGGEDFEVLVDPIVHSGAANK
jgi:hypothetical protein